MISGLEKTFITSMCRILYIISFFFLFACESNVNSVQKIYKTTFTATGEADSIHLKYTDSGRIKSSLQSLKMLDYSTAKNPFIEFPKGVLVKLFDVNGKVTTVKADRAYSFKNTSVIDLQGNVEFLHYDGKKLNTEQLFFDQKNEWFFTDEYFKFSDENGSYIEGIGVDFSKNFKKFNMQNNKGSVNNID